MKLHLTDKHVAQCLIYTNFLNIHVLQTDIFSVIPPYSSKVAKMSVFAVLCLLLLGYHGLLK